MEEIIQEIQGLKEQAGYRRSPQEVYETTFEKCRTLRSCPWKGGPMPWMFEGMTNNVKPMWAVLVGGRFGNTLGFVWDTTVSPNDISVQEITAVKCEVWNTWDISFGDTNGLIEKMRLLGTTTLREEEIAKAGSDLSFLKRLTLSKSTSERVWMSSHSFQVF